MAALAHVWLLRSYGLRAACWLARQHALLPSPARPYAARAPAAFRLRCVHGSLRRFSLYTTLPAVWFDTCMWRIARPLLSLLALPAAVIPARACDVAAAYHRCWDKPQHAYAFRRSSARRRTTIHLPLRCHSGTSTQFFMTFNARSRARFQYINNAAHMREQHTTFSFSAYCATVGIDARRASAAMPPAIASAGSACPCLLCPRFAFAPPAYHPPTSPVRRGARTLYVVSYCRPLLYNDAFAFPIYMAVNGAPYGCYCAVRLR